MRTCQDNGKLKNVFLRCFHIVGAALVLFAIIGGCPVYQLFHVCCPCCGITRAWLCFFQGDLMRAFRYHGLFPLIPLVAALYLTIDVIPNKWKGAANTAMITSGIAIAIYGVLRWCGFVAMP